VTALAPADVIIVVDVFSFTTCVDVAVKRGVAILPYAWNDASAADFAQSHGAELAGKRRKFRYSLAPESYLDAPEGLRCVLPSPNGAQVTLAAAATGAVVLAGCLRNGRAVAEAAQRIGRTFNVIPSGERWLDGSLRPALDGRGHPRDKFIAGELDVSSCVPRFDGLAFVAADAGRQ
jgi:2-phosphosulfolactate phosphatase